MLKHILNSQKITARWNKSLQVKSDLGSMDETGELFWEIWVSEWVMKGSPRDASTSKSLLTMYVRKVWLNVLKAWGNSVQCCGFIECRIWIFCKSKYIETTGVSGKSKLICQLFCFYRKMSVFLFIVTIHILLFCRKRKFSFFSCSA